MASALSSRGFAIEIAASHICMQKALEARLKQFPMYFDNQATTPTDPRVLDTMMPFYMHRFGNAHSKTHKYGLDAEAVVETARGVSNEN